MMTANERTEFAPPPTPGLVRALVLAILAHLVLVGFLALGVQWKRDAAPVTVEAELWSSVPQEAAPPPPPPVAPQDPEPPKPATPTKAPPVVEKVAPPEPQPDPSIAIAREKQRLKKEKQARQEEQALEKKKLARLEEERRQQEELKDQKRKAEKEAKDKADRAQVQHDKLLQDKKLQKAKKDKAKDAAEAQKLADLRRESLRRMAALAGSSGDANARGSALHSSGPSAGYAGRIRARIKPNITYLETISGNPAAEVEVRATATGTILSRKLTKSSGVASWDQAVLNAIDKTEVLPTDIDGRTPSVITLVFRPRD
jgi:colicin import membrane protein